jgi:hypothetical protein
LQDDAGAKNKHPSLVAGIGEGTMLNPIESPSPPRSVEKVPKADEGASYHSGKRQDRHL